jgi:hypothetical protein
VQHLRVERCDAIRRVHPRHDVVEALRAEDDLERRVGVVRGVESPDAVGDRGAALAEVALRDLELEPVLTLLRADPVELDVRGVVLLDRALEVRIQAVDLSQDLVGLGLLRPNRGVRYRRDCGEKSRENPQQNVRRLSLAGSDQCPLLGAGTRRTGRGRYDTSAGG